MWVLVRCQRVGVGRSKVLMFDRDKILISTGGWLKRRPKAFFSYELVRVEVPR